MASAPPARRPPDATDPVLEVLDEHECMRLLASGTVGRLGVTVGAIPAILPVNYAMLEDSVVFRTGPGTKLRAALDNTVVAFEVDEVDEATQSGWSVLMVGIAHELTGTERDEAAALPLEPWAPSGLEHFVAVSRDLVSGRRLLPRHPA